MTAARRVLLAAQILALGGPALVVAWIVFVSPPDAVSLATMTYDVTLAVAQGLAGLVWSAVLIHNHIELRNGSNYRVQVMATIVTAMFALIFFTILLPPLLKH